VGSFASGATAGVAIVADTLSRLSVWPAVPLRKTRAEQLLKVVKRGKESKRLQLDAASELFKVQWQCSAV
jgi:hypothetical protein